MIVSTCMHEHLQLHRLVCYYSISCDDWYVLTHRELSRFIASGRLHCRIDKVGGVVETNRPDSKNFLYQVSAHVQPSVYV